MHVSCGGEKLSASCSRMQSLILIKIKTFHLVQWYFNYKAAENSCGRWVTNVNIAWKHIPWPLWFTSLAAMTLLMTVCRKSLSPATLGEKRDDRLSGLWRMTSSKASLEGAHHRHHHRGHRATGTREWMRLKHRVQQSACISPQETENRNKWQERQKDQWSGNNGRRETASLGP